MSAGALILLYLVYTLFFTNFVAEREQQELLQHWGLQNGATDADSGSQRRVDSNQRHPASDINDAVEVGDAYAVMWFERPGDDARPVHGDPLAVVEGVDLETLKRGPGHYPETAAPGQPGNFAVAGHRTTYGAPFYHLDQLRAGDEIHVLDRKGRRWVYEVTETRVVLPQDTWVIERDPLGTGTPIMSLTTCEPRFSAAKRLIVFAELRP